MDFCLPKVVFDCAKWDSVSGWREHFLVMPLGEFCFALEEVALDIVVLIRKYVPGFPKKCPIPNVSIHSCSPRQTVVDRI